jgi:shikimate dehydrogenase
MCRLATGWSGYNTDALALRELASEIGRTNIRSALIIGAGGAARATVAALSPLGVRVFIGARDADEAVGLRDQVAAAKIVVELTEWARVPEMLPDIECIVNAAPCDTDHSPALITALRHDHFVVDWVYGGTSLTSAARRLGCPFVGGNALLVRQGALANKLWTGLEPPERSMALAVAEAAAKAST